VNKEGRSRLKKIEAHLAEVESAGKKTEAE